MRIFVILSIFIIAERIANYHSSPGDLLGLLPVQPCLYLLAPKNGLAPDEERSFLKKCAFDPKLVRGRHKAVPYQARPRPGYC
jgi:hypothetical protein